MVTPGVTGFIESSLDDLVSAIKKVDKLSREAVRREFEARFTAETMVDRYEQIYLRVMNADDSKSAEIASDG